MMNFSVLPPEINSVRIFAGAGPQPMLAAATAWDGLAGELAGAASSFSSVASGLVDGSWRGRRQRRWRLQRRHTPDG
ncbi:PPE family protein [Mycobacterium kansasii]|uniref:PPE family protein n=1 Tax=Mycobacterium kansasii TaxID=1768 RepID=A0A1V3XST1_MYCKA|nr:PPE family protein [Mycobacterium kansasii]